MLQICYLAGILNLWVLYVVLQSVHCDTLLGCMFSTLLETKKALLEIPKFHSRELCFVSWLCFWFQLPANVSTLWKQKINWRLTCLDPKLMGEMSIESLLPGFCLALAQVLWTFEYSLVGKNSPSFALSLSPPFSASLIFSLCLSNMFFKS